VPVAAYTAFGLFGKTSWPNAMVPFIQRNPASSILFLLFMLAGDFFLVRVIVAVAFASFSDSANARLLRQAELSRIAVRRAFRLLADADTGFVSLEAFRALAIKVRPSVPAEVYDVVFRAVGGDCGLLGPTAFVAACRLLDVNARPVPGAVRTARAIARLLEEAPPRRRVRHGLRRLRGGGHQRRHASGRPAGQAQAAGAQQLGRRRRAPRTRCEQRAAHRRGRGRGRGRG